MNSERGDESVSVSVVMPAYNEGEHLELCVREWYDNVVSRIPSSELIIVDDCSRDNTHEILQELAAGMPELRALRPSRNGGHGRAVRFGLGHARGEFVFQTDSDRQHSPEDFWKLWERRLECDCVFGVREHRADGSIRVLVTRSMRFLNFLVWQMWIQDANCPFKLIRKSVLDKVLPMIPEDSFIPMVMLAILVRRERFSVSEVPVLHLPRVAGQQSLRGLLNWIRVGRRCAKQLVMLRLGVAVGPGERG